MAWQLDFTNLKRLIADQTVQGPVLEIGSYNHAGDDFGNAKFTCEQAGIAWEGADFAEGPGVDRLFDVLDTAAVEAITDRWQSILLFNLLEHVYDPITALRNTAKLLAPGGVVVISGPAIWELHDFPIDVWRPMPGFFFEHAKREGLEVVDGSPVWLVNERLIPYASLVDGKQHLAPSSRFIDAVHGPKARLARVLQGIGARLGYDTYAFPFTSFSIALRKPA